MTKRILLQTKSKVVPFEQNGEFYYRKAQRFVNNNNYIDALYSYRKAVEKEPDNANYLMDLAEVFTEMNYYDESNQILFYLIQSEKEQSTECYFGLGCNFLGLQEFKKAEECFMKYLDMEPEGDFAEEAQDLLEILQTQDFYYNDFDGNLSDSLEKLYKMANKGKEYLDNGEYKKAIKQLEKVLHKDSTLIFVRNNLALAYFCDNKVDKAIEIVKPVLDEDSNNVHANCNLALFYNESGDIEKATQYIDKVMSFKTEDPEEIYKIAVTFCELRYHEQANQLLKELLQYRPYDKKILHYYAVSYFNLKNYRKAISYWDKIEKIDPFNTIASFYKSQTRQYLKNNMLTKEYPYHYQVPYDEILKRIKRINDLTKYSNEEINRKWANSDQIMSLLLWGLKLNDKVIKKAIINLIASFHDEKAEKMFRYFILQKNEMDSLKKEVLALLKQMNAKEPYVAYMDGNILEIHVNILDFDGDRMPIEYQKVLDLTLQKMNNRYPDEYANDIIRIWKGYIKSLSSNYPRISRKEAWAAALEYCYCLEKGIKVFKSEICKFYETSTSTLNHHLARLQEVIREGDMK